MDAVADRLGSESDVARTRTVVMIGSDDEHGPVYVAGSPLSVFPGKIVPHGATSHSPPSSDQATPSSAESWSTVAVNTCRPQFAMPAEGGSIVTETGVVPIVTYETPKLSSSESEMAMTAT